MYTENNYSVKYLHREFLNLFSQLWVREFIQADITGYQYYERQQRYCGVMLTEPSSLDFCSLEILIILPPNSFNPVNGMCAIFLFVMIILRMTTQQRLKATFILVGPTLGGSFSCSWGQLDRGLFLVSLWRPCWIMSRERRLGHEKGVSALWRLMDQNISQTKETKGLLDVGELLTFGDVDLCSTGLKGTSLGFEVLVP